MIEKNKWRGIVVILALSVIAFGLGIAWVVLDVEPTQNQANAPIKSEMSHAETGNKHMPKKPPVKDTKTSQLGIIGEKNDPKFAKIRALLDKSDYKGGVLLVRNGKAIWQQGFGEMAPGIPYNPDAPIPLTSLSKNVTAYLLMKELSKHNLSLDTKLSYFYPEMPGAKQTTLRELVRMDAKYDGSGYSSESLTEAEYLAEYLHFVTYNPEPRMKWHYNSANYQILSNVLYKLSKTPYHLLVTKTLTPKYHVLNADEFARLPNRPMSYDKDGEFKAFKEQRFNREVGTGSLFMAPWDAYRLIRDEINGHNLTTREFVEMTKSRTTRDYGYSGGMYKYDYGYLLHGMMQGFEPSMMLDKSGQNAVVLFSNQSMEKMDDELAAPIYKELWAI